MHSCFRICNICLSSAIACTKIVLLRWYKNDDDDDGECCFCHSEAGSPHCCCHVASNFGSCQIFPILHNAMGDVPHIILPLLRGICPHLIRGSWPTLVHTPNVISVGSAVFVRPIVVMNSFTDHISSTASKWHLKARLFQAACNINPIVNPSCADSVLTLALCKLLT